MASTEHLAILKLGTDAWNEWRKSNPALVPDLEEADFGAFSNHEGLNLRGANLRKAKISRVNFRGVIFEGADLSYCAATRAQFEKCRFGEAQLFRANLHLAEFRNCAFPKADLTSADLGGARFTKTDLSKAILRECSLDNANFRNGKAIQADFEWANLRHLTAVRARFEDASFRSASLDGADFSEANFQGADLQEVDLTNACLDGADLRGAKIDGAKMAPHQRATAIIDPESIGSIALKDGYSVAIRLDGNVDGVRVATLEALIREIEGRGTGCHIRIISLSNNQATVALTDAGDRNIADVMSEMRELRQKYSLAVRRLDDKSAELTRLKLKYEALLLKMAKGNDHKESVDATIIFFDVAGFSEMDDEAKSDLLDAVWHNGKVLIKGEDIYVSNTWGDGIMAAFANPNAALSCATRLIASLRSIGHIARIGVSWGRATLSYNDIRSTYDLIGRSVDVAARLEPLIKQTDPDVSVLASAEVYHLHEIDIDRFEFKEMGVTVNKAFADHEVGDIITATL